MSARLEQRIGSSESNLKNGLFGVAISEAAIGILSYRFSVPALETFFLVILAAPYSFLLSNLYPINNIVSYMNPLKRVNFRRK